MQKLKIIPLLVLILFISAIYAQGHVTSPTKFRLRGTILESEGNNPIEYAGILLYASNDSTVTDGTITDNLGNFVIELSRPGTYTMVVQFIGYEKYTLKGLSLTPKTPELSLKPILISPSAITLAEATVTDRRNEVIYKIDRKVIQVSGNANTIGTTAVEVLENTPGFEVDDEGNVKLRGSDNFTVLINGKPTVLSGNDALKQIPSGSIESIEVITNPSARYDPDGLTGIVNVILKKEASGGLNGLVDLSAGNRDRYSASLSLNYRRKAHSITVGYDYNQSRREGKSYGKRQSFKNGDTITRVENGTQSFIHPVNNLRLGYDVDLTPKSSLNLNGLIRIGGVNSKLLKNQEISFSNIDSTVNRITENSSNGNRTSYDLSSSFLHKFDNEGHELQLLGSLSSSKMSNHVRNYSEIKPSQSNLEWFDSSWTVENFQNIQLDYSIPVGLVKFETGAKSRFREIDFENHNTQNPFSLQNPINHLLYNDQIHALYVIGSSKIESWEFQLGLRTEYYRIELFQKADNTKSIKSDINFFPTIHLSNSVGNSKFMVGYSRRVNRPMIYYLNPYETFYDIYNVSKGNPGLDPEYSHSIEVNYLRYFGQSTANATLFYRQTDNAISWVRRLYDPVNSPGIMLTTFENMNEQSSLGIEVGVRHSFARWLQFDGNYSFYNFRITGKIDGMEVNNNSINHTFRANLTFKVGRNAGITVNGMYNSPSASAQGKRGAYFNNGVSYRHHIFDRRGTVSLSIRNPIGKMRWEFTSSGAGFNDYVYRQPYMPIVTVGFSYKINDGIKRQRSSGDRVEEFSGEMEM